VLRAMGEWHRLEMREDEPRDPPDPPA